MKRGRPKASVKKNSKQSFGPIGDLIRKYRLEKGLGLIDIAEKCKCSVQFIFNIEHGRAPLPWEMTDALAKVLSASPEDVRAANLAMRADFKNFIGVCSGKKVKKPSGLADVAAAITITAQSEEIQKLIQKYQAANEDSKKKFLTQAGQLLEY